MAKKKFQIALNPGTHNTIRAFAEQSSTSIGSVVELATNTFVRRVMSSLESGEVPNGVGPLTEVGRLLGYKDRGILDEETFQKEIDSLRLLPGDEIWTKE